MAFTSLKETIASLIKENGTNDITGDLLQQVLISIVNNVGADSTYRGVAGLDTSPGIPDGNVFYFANTPGTYANFNTTLVENQLAVFSWDSVSKTWTINILLDAVKLPILNVNDFNNNPTGFYSLATAIASIRLLFPITSN